MKKRCFLADLLFQSIIKNSIDKHRKEKICSLIVHLHLNRSSVPDAAVPEAAGCGSSGDEFFKHLIEAVVDIEGRHKLDLMVDQTFVDLH